MHELSVVSGLFEVLEEKAREAGAVRVTAVTIRVGRLSGVVPDLLESAFDAFKKGTIASGAALRVETAPVRARCRSCGKEASTEEPLFSCPACGAPGLEILEGMDIFLQKIEIET
jgi:hydrogenase nickel incorporation protein HypA/HybF